MKIGYINGVLQRIPVKRFSRGYFVRWYYNGWHYWNFLPGSVITLTEGENYRTVGSRKIGMASGQVTRGQIEAIRTIMNSREVSLLTTAGWMNIRIEPGAVIPYDHQMLGNELNFTAILGSRESYYSPVIEIPVIPPGTPDPDTCEITIGAQIWMCKNYDGNYPGSKVYNNSEPNRILYGGLYTFDQIMNPGFAPPGYHVATKAEWEELIAYVNDFSNTGGILKIAGTTYWDAPNEGAVNTYNFGQRGSGYYGLLVGLSYGFAGLKTVANIWAATQSDALNGYAIQIGNSTAEISMVSLPKEYLFAVRLIKNTLPPPVTFTITTSRAGTVFSLDLIGGGDIFIDWGDGNNVTGTLIPEAYTTFTHTYVAGGTATVTGSAFKVIKADTEHITACVIPPECTTLEILNLYNNDLTSFVTHAEWKQLNAINLGINPGLTNLIPHAEWIPKLNTFSAYACAITNAADINNILITLDNAGFTWDGIGLTPSIDLTGGTNAAPTGAGITAKNNLIARGIDVLTN